MPGTVRGKLKREIAEEIGLTDEVDVIAVGSHDTASAVYAIPSTQVDKSRCAFLSSGTWSLLGVELAEPILTEEACRAGFTNEGGPGLIFTYCQKVHRWSNSQRRQNASDGRMQLSRNPCNAHNFHERTG